MKTLRYWTACLAVLLVAFGGISPAFAKKKKNGGNARSTDVIFEVSAVSITVDTPGDTKTTYKINDATKITLNGVAATADDLLAGMAVSVTGGPDTVTAVSIDATNPPK